MQPLEYELEESVVLQKRLHVEKPCVIAKCKVLNFPNPIPGIYLTCHRGRDNFHITLDIAYYRLFHTSHVLNDYFIGEISSLTSMYDK